MRETSKVIEKFKTKYPWGCASRGVKPLYPFPLNLQNMSRVTCKKKNFFKKKKEKIYYILMDLVDGGCVIMWPTPSSF